MPIEFYTGLPGNGKTAFMVERLIAESKKAQRPIVAAGIDGLAPGHAYILDDPRRWNDRGPDGEYLVPDGSLVFIDEAWKWFGHLHDASRQATPPHVLALAEHRHRGLDFVWTTQQPNQIYPFARALGSRHTHVVRRFGTQYCDLYTWEELNEDVKSSAKRENAVKQTRMLPKEVFDQYKSATLHTIKRRIPFKLFVLPLAIVLSAGSAYFAYQHFKPDAVAARLSEKGASAAQAAPPPSEQPRDQGDEAPLTAAEYVQRQQARIASAPWTAPLYDERPVTSDPQLFCMSGGEPQGPGCRCYTEQATVYELPLDECKRIAKVGPIYNPFKERSDELQQGQQLQQNAQTSPTDMGQATTVLQGLHDAGWNDQQARYGQMRAEPAGIDPAGTAQ